MNETELRILLLLCQDASVSSHGCKRTKYRLCPVLSRETPDWWPGSHSATPALSGVLAVVEGILKGDSSGGVMAPVECGAEGTEEIHDPEITDES